MTSEIKVNKVSDSCGSALVSKCGSTITIGASGKTISLASGASQTGFGRSGSVNWQTAIKTANFTAVSGEGYFCNTTGGAITLTLPSSPSVGDIVAFKDYALTFDTNKLSINRNGSNVNGTAGTTLDITTEGASVVLIYADSTKGWIPTQDDESSIISTTPTFITATGGTISTVCTDYKVHTFTSPGTFTVCSVGNQYGSNEVSYMVVAGGGAGGTHTNPFGQGGSGGGGAGGFREGKSPQDSYTSSSLACTVSTNNGLPVSATGYPIVIGAGGTQVNYPAPGNGGNGSDSTFSTITSGAGGGGARGGQSATGNNGGSGGGGAGAPGLNPGGTGNTPPVSPPQGTNGGKGKCGAYGGGGGGGATVVGWDAIAGTGGGPGAPLKGTGATTSINGTPTAFAGGGGGGGWSSPGTPSATTNAGGAGGGGTGAYGPQPSPTNATAGTTNTGGGGGGSYGSANADGGAGGSGIVIIRYKFQ